MLIHNLQDYDTVICIYWPCYVLKSAVFLKPAIIAHDGLKSTNFAILITLLGLYILYDEIYCKLYVRSIL